MDEKPIEAIASAINRLAGKSQKEIADNSTLLEIARKLLEERRKMLANDKNPYVVKLDATNECLVDIDLTNALALAGRALEIAGISKP